MIDVDAIKARFDMLSPILDERGWRLFAATEARAAGQGGIMAVYQATGIARSTIGRGLAELRRGDDPLEGCVRRHGAGRKAANETQPGLLAALDELVQSSIRGDPEAALRWVSKSQRRLSAALAGQGFTAGPKLVGRLLKRLGFSLQANRKTREGSSHPDRNVQFEHINAEVKAFQATGQPVISVDTKKKELVGDFKNGGRELRPKGCPEPVQVHDFPVPALGKAVSRPQGRGMMEGVEESRSKRRLSCNGADRACESGRYPTRKGADFRRVSTEAKRRSGNCHWRS